jgi:NAD(P)H-hydrate epimerase
LPETIHLPLTGTPEENASQAAAALNQADALVLGCGLGQSEAAAALVATLCVPQTKPAVLDADALNLLAATPMPLALSPLEEEAPVTRVLTPHIGEMARLTGAAPEEILADAAGFARRAARDWGSVVVLKSSSTVIAAPDGRTLTLDAPNSGLAKGGSGDVLAGIIAGLLAQGLPAFDAAGCGVWLHSTAARRAAQEKGEAAMLATDVLGAL